MLATPDGRRTPIVDAMSQAQWIDPDWIVFVREGTLVAQRVDLEASTANRRSRLHHGAGGLLGRHGLVERRRVSERHARRAVETR